MEGGKEGGREEGIAIMYLCGNTFLELVVIDGRRRRRRRSSSSSSSSSKRLKDRTKKS